MKNTTQKTTAMAVVAKTPATKALTVKQIAAQAAKSAAFFAAQEAVKPVLQVPAAATVSHNSFAMLVKQAEKAVVEIVNENIANSFEAELQALQEKHGVTGTVKYAKPKTAKEPRAAKVQQNGITRPASTSVCGLIWSICDNNTTPGQPAQVSVVRADVALKDTNDHTIKTQYARWRAFNGITGRVAHSTKSIVQGQDNGLTTI